MFQMMLLPYNETSFSELKQRANFKQFSETFELLHQIQLLHQNAENDPNIDTKILLSYIPE